MRLTLLLCLGLMVAAGLAAAADDPGLTPDAKTLLGLPAGFAPEYVVIAQSPDQKLTDEQAKIAAPDILLFEGCHVGENRILLKTTFARPPQMNGYVFIVYADLDNNPKTGRVDPYHGGVDTHFAVSDRALSMNYYPGSDSGNTGARMVMAGNVMYMTIDYPFKPQDGKITVGLHLLSQRGNGPSDSTKHVVVSFPVSTATVPRLPLGRGGIARPASDFRYFGDKVTYEKLSDKGLREEQVTPADPIKFGRPRPEVQYFAKGRTEKKGSVDVRRVPVEIQEEANVARQAAILSFGFPLPQGALFGLDKMKLVDGNREVPAQFTATGFWPDDSLKWVLIDATLSLRAGEKRELAVEFGNNVMRAMDGPAIPRSGDPFGGLESHAVLVDESGGRFVGEPKATRFEQEGPRKLVGCFSGEYRAPDQSAYFRYAARVTSRVGTPLVEVALTTTDEYLKTEFADLTSLSVTLTPPRGTDGVRVYVQTASGELAPGPSNGLTQLDENTLASGPGKGTGVVTWNGGGAVIHDFWQRYPKGIRVQDGQIVFDLLPQQPSADYGKDLPYWDMFNLCEGKYRFKWGMAFTEKISFDFSGKMKPEELWAEAQRPIVPVIPATWYAETKAIGPIAPVQGKQFALWDKFIDDSLKNYMTEKQRSREYGFMNYGDWFGERGRNWGNNEYDLAHGLFMHFVRTGNRDAFRWATKAAQHRADVDTIWAYPDPMNVGATPPHAIGHTGAWTEATERSTWDCRYDGMYTAANGHNWCDGLMDDWMLTGNPRAMESGLAFGEHVAYAMAPNFKELGTHERSAGWSLRSIMAVYKATYDPVYLEAAKKIAAVALKEQKFDQGGAWPHVLPKDHAGSEQGAVGNNLFLIGVLLGGLQAYHEASQDPAVLKSLESGALWVAKSFDEQAGGWPYSAKTDGTPLYTPSVGLNQLIIGALAYTGRVTNNEKLLNIASEAMSAATMASPGGNGKGMAQFIFFTSGTIAELQQWYAKTRPDKGLSILDGSPESMAALLVRTATSNRHGVRAPDQKVFYVRLKQDITELTLTRTPHGAMNKRAEFATFQVLSDDGKVVAQEKCSTDEGKEFKVPLVGKGPATFKVVIDDDQRGVWTLKDPGAQIITQTSPEFRIGGVGRARLYFMVPPGTKEFSLKLVGVHTGPYGAVVLDPQSKMAGAFSGNNPGEALVPRTPGADAPRAADHPELGTLTVKPAANQTAKIWSVILTAAGDIGVELVGVPPYLALSPEDWFAPR